MKIRQGLSLAVCAAILMSQPCKAAPTEEELVQGAASVKRLSDIFAGAQELQEWFSVEDLSKLFLPSKALCKDSESSKLFKRKAREYSKYEKYWNDADQATLADSNDLQEMSKTLKKVEYISHVMERFLRGTLIYRPNPDSDEGKVELPIRDLPNPFEGEFDLSECGDMVQRLSINTGYRTESRTEKIEDKSGNKLQTWIVPHSVIKKDLITTAAHFQRMMKEWDPDIAPVGLVWTRGRWNKNLEWFDFLTEQDLDELGNNNLFQKLSRARCWGNVANAGRYEAEDIMHFKFRF